MKGDIKARDRYLSFLQSGGNDYPIALLKKAGVDMAKPAAIEEAIALFSTSTKRLAHYVSKC
jgi:oligoendopeptidase F